MLNDLPCRKKSCHYHYHCCYGTSPTDNQDNHLLSWAISRQNSGSPVIATNWFIFTMLISQIPELMFTFVIPLAKTVCFSTLRAPNCGDRSVYDKMLRVLWLLSKLKSLQQDVGTSCKFKSLCVPWGILVKIVVPATYLVPSLPSPTAKTGKTP